MNRRPASSARMLGRGVALIFGIFVVFSGASCGRQTFDLLGLDASAPSGGAANPGAADGAGDSSVTPSGGHGGSHGTARGGSGSGAAQAKAGAGNGGANVGASGDGQGGNDEPCLPGESCVDGGVSCPPTVNFCKRCDNDTDCGHGAPPYCDVADGRCVECFPGRGNCKVGENCDPTFLRCAKACQTAADCDENHRICDPSRDVCVDCTNSSHCAAVAGHENYRCAAGFCVECLDYLSCVDPAKPVCLQFHCVAKP